MTIDQIVLGYNSTLIWFAFAVAALFSYRVVKSGVSNKETRRLMEGVILVSLGLIFHRTYWQIPRIQKLAGDEGVSFDYYTWELPLIGVVVFVTCLGYALHLYPVFNKAFKRWWFIGAVVTWLAVFFASAYAPLVL